MAEENEQLSQEEIDQARADAVKEVWGEEAETGGLATPLEDETTKPDGTLPPEGDETVVKKEEEVVVEDPWAGVSPALRKQFEDLQSKVSDRDELANRLKQAESRIGGITNQLHESKKAAEKAAADAKQAKEEAPTKEEIEAAAKTEQDWEELKKEFPAWAEVMDNRLAADNAKQSKALEKQLTHTKELLERLGKIEESINTSSSTPSEEVVQLRKEVVSVRHPGWEQTIKTPEFGEWYQNQGADVQKRCNSDRPTDAIHVLDLYENHTANKGKSAAEIAAERKKRLKTAEIPSGGRQRQVAKSDDDKTDEEYRKEIAAKIWAET